MSNLSNANSPGTPIFSEGTKQIEGENLSNQMVVLEPAPALLNPVADLSASLDQPHSYPPLGKIFTPSDNVFIVLDHLFCTRADLLEPLLDRILQAGIEVHQITFLVENASLEAELIAGLPDRFEEAVITVHERANPSRNAIVAVSATGERISFSRGLIDADQIVVAGYAGIRAHRGPVGGCHQLWPGLAEKQSEAPQKVVFSKPFRPDFSKESASSREACWLLGAPFFIMALPGKGGIPSGFISGSDAALDLVFDKKTVLAPESNGLYKAGVARWTSVETIPFDQMVDAACRLGEMLEPGIPIHLSLEGKGPSPQSIADLRLGGIAFGDTMARLWARILSKNTIHLWGTSLSELAKALAVTVHLGSPDLSKGGPWLVLEDGYWG